MSFHMNITNPSESPVITDDHPTGALAFRYVIKGQMNPGQGRDELKNAGRFGGPAFIRQGADGRVTKDLSINAIWKEVIGERPMAPNEWMAPQLPGTEPLPGESVPETVRPCV